MAKVLGVVLLCCASACAVSDSDLDEQAASDGADGKADTYSVTRLERATPTQVANSFQDVRGQRLTECFVEYQARIDATATTLSDAATNEFWRVRTATNGAACGDYDLEEIVDRMLTDLGVTEATPADLVAGMAAWAKPQLQAASVSGYVQVKDLSLMFYDDLMRTRDANAMSREKDPAGIDLTAIRSQWDTVQDQTTLDRAYLNPVTFPAGALDGSNVFRYLRAAFPLRRLSLESTGYTAVADFAGAGEGPDGDPAFAPIATALRKGSIKKRFYYVGGGTGWSSNVLIVVDEHGQAWGMQMGYSE